MPHSFRFRRGHFIIVAVLAGLVGAVATAGPLDPPPGSVASTYKTLTEVEPRIAVSPANTPGDGDSVYKITQPGSYYLTGNVSGAIGKHGIEIASAGVTLDLNGFELAGVPGMGLFDGVSTTLPGLGGITVRNGSVRNWGGDGIDLATAPVSGAVVEGIRAGFNGANGISVGAAVAISGCTATSNVLSGIVAGNAATISGCAARSNSQRGFVLGFGGTVRGCTASGNFAVGYVTGEGCTLADSAAFDNTGDGFTIASGGALASCVANGNTQDGFSIAHGSAANCNADDNTLNGFSVSFSILTNCTANGNGTNGFSSVVGNSTIAGCSAHVNTLDGIVCSVNCVIRDNTCVGNGVLTSDGANIHVTASDNRVEGNNCADADRGIDVDAGGNVIVRNACSGNTTNWVIAANNVYGPIIDRVGVASPAVNGNSAADATGSTHPNANFSY